MSIHASNASSWQLKTTIPLSNTNYAATPYQGMVLWSDDKGALFTTTLSGTTTQIYNLNQSVLRIAELGNMVLAQTEASFQAYNLNLIDLTQNKTIATLANVNAFTMHGKELWAITGDETISELDPSNLNTLKSIQTSIQNISGLVACDDLLVTNNQNGQMEAYDPQDGTKTFAVNLSTQYPTLITRNLGFIAAAFGMPGVINAALQFWNTKQDTPFMVVPISDPSSFIQDLYDAEGTYFMATYKGLQLRSTSCNFQLLATYLDGTSVNQVLKIDPDTVIACSSKSLTVFSKAAASTSYCSII